MAAGDQVHVNPGVVPPDYHCTCQYCRQVIGELRPPDGTYYSRLERRKYYDPSESGGKGHVAKTPLHIARWAVQRFTRPGDWVLDPTIGAGTTAVEAITQHRNAAGMEVQFSEILEANVARNLTNGVQAKLRIGDARTIGGYLDELGVKFSLVVNNPPYSGDEHMTTLDAVKPEGYRHQSITFKYKDNLPNLAFLKEGPAYWEAIRLIYQQCIDHLEPGGHFVTGIKDMVRKKQPLLLHRTFCETLEGLGMEFVGTAFLRHYPGTQFLNTYEKITGVRPPWYQTISVFRRP